MAGTIALGSYELTDNDLMSVSGGEMSWGGFWSGWRISAGSVGAAITLTGFTAHAMGGAAVIGTGAALALGGGILVAAVGIGIGVGYMAGVW